jgi:hypothetical protein
MAEMLEPLPSKCKVLSSNRNAAMHYYSIIAECHSVYFKNHYFLSKPFKSRFVKEKHRIITHKIHLLENYLIIS